MSPPNWKRLITLTGPGGSGKTRLALQLAGELAAEFPDGAGWVDLAPVAHGRAVPHAVAAALDVPERTQSAPLEALIAHLRARRLLLVLDNCEHQLPACAAIVEHLLPACPGLTVLATTLEPLGVSGESVWPVRGLSLPETGDAAAVDQSEAVQLFVERAQLAWPTFTLNDRNRQAVAQICRRLDGIPLAIELAATRVRLLSPAQIAARLDDRLDLLRSTSRASPPRHQTLRALVDWSFGLLAPPEQALLRRLSVFAGGFTLEAAEAVCGDEGQAVLDGLARLVDRSLVFVESATGVDTRYRLLETIRQYAREKLRDAGESERWRNRHLGFLVRLAAEVEPTLYGPEQVASMDRLEVELPDIRAALEWALSSGQLEAAQRLAGDLWIFWHLRGYNSEGLDLLRRALAAGGPMNPALRARTLYRAGYFAPWEANAEARALLEQGLALCRDLEDRLGLGLSLTLLGWRILYDEPETGAAWPYLEEGLARLREQAHPWGLSMNLHISSLAALYQRNFAIARQFAEDSLAVARQMGNDWHVATGLYTLAELARFTGDHVRAEVLYNEVDAVGRKLRFAQRSHAALRAGLGYALLRQGKVELAQSAFRESLLLATDPRVPAAIAAMALAGLGGVAAAQGETQRATRLLGASEALLQARQAHLETQDRAEFERDLASVCQVLDEATYAAAWSQGCAMSLAQAVELALNSAADT